MKTKLVSVALLSLAVSAVVADDRFPRPAPVPVCPHCVAAPEIDPAQAASALVLLSGTVAILRGRRNRRK
jgi:hypothetical protein